MKRVPSGMQFRSASWDRCRAAPLMRRPGATTAKASGAGDPPTAGASASFFCHSPQAHSCVLQRQHGVDGAIGSRGLCRAADVSVHRSSRSIVVFSAAISSGTTRQSFGLPLHYYSTDQRQQPDAGSEKGDQPVDQDRAGDGNAPVFSASVPNTVFAVAGGHFRRRPGDVEAVVPPVEILPKANPVALRLRQQCIPGHRKRKHVDVHRFLASLECGFD